MTGQHLDVIIVGAGLSGIGAGYHLQTQCPGKRYLILESREVMGGTWDLFRYPGIRSDSDMHTLGYNFKPWVAEKAIAEGPAILSYIHETAEENAISQHIRYRHRLVRASWSSPDACWTLEVQREEQDSVTFTCNFLLMCAGYYRHREGFTPDFPGIARFQAAAEGGVGIFNALIAPLVFATIAEYPIAIVLVCGPVHGIQNRLGPPGSTNTSLYIL